MGNLVLPKSFQNNQIGKFQSSMNEAQNLDNNPNTQDAQSKDTKDSNAKLTEFEKSLKVAGIKQKNLPKTNYQKLNSQTEEQLKLFLSNVTMQDISNFEEINNAEGISSNGENFKCFSPSNGDGTVIVTPNKVISVNKKDENNYDYTETRQNKAGLKKATIHTASGISSIKYNTATNAKDMRELETFSTFFGNTKNAMNLEMQGMSEQEKAQYVLELTKLGIKPAEDKLASIDELAGKYTPSQLEKAKEEGKLLHSSTASIAEKENGVLNKKSATILYGDNEETPKTIWLASQKGNSNNPQLNVYRRAANGKYFDSSSKTFVNGNLKYQMVGLDDIEQKMENEGFSIGKFNKTISKNAELGGKLPEEAGMINNSAEKQKEQQKNRELEEEEEGYHTFSDNRHNQ